MTASARRSRTVYDIAWRVDPDDGSALAAQPLAAECLWRGGWGALSQACDRLAQARAGVRLLATASDPRTDMGGMGLAEACAFRIAAFAPPGERVLLAFHSTEEGWARSEGFAIFDYVTGEAALARRTG